MLWLLKEPKDMAVPEAPVTNASSTRDSCNIGVEEEEEKKAAAIVKTIIIPSSTEYVRRRPSVFKNKMQRISPANDFSNNKNEENIEDSDSVDGKDKQNPQLGQSGLEIKNIDMDELLANSARLHN